jgi:hypothetical protein
MGSDTRIRLERALVPPRGVRLQVRYLNGYDLPFTIYDSPFTRLPSTSRAEAFHHHQQRCC